MSKPDFMNLKPSTLWCALSALPLLITLSKPALAEEPIVNVTISCIALERGLEDLIYISNGEVRTLVLFKEQRSSTSRYIGPPRITFFKEIEARDLNGETIIERIPVSTWDVPTETGAYLLVWTRDRRNTDRYLTIAFEDDWKNFPIGSVRFLNLAPFELAVKLEEEIYQIQAQGQTTLNPEFDSSGNRKAIMVSLPRDEKPLRVFDGFMYYTPTVRTLYIVLPKEGGRPGRVKFRSIPEAFREVLQEEPSS